MAFALERFSVAVQKNCHISDAQHGADYGLCTYLIKMREYYRWEQGLSYGSSLKKDEVGDWLSEREALWQSLQDEPFADLPLSESSCDPFDVHAINRELEPLGLVYSAGYGLKNKPLFFLGHLERHVDTGASSIWISGRELARDLTAPAAMNQGEHIYLRQESFRRLLWEKLESWRWHRPDNALGRAFACYDFEQNLEQSLDAMVEHELAAVLMHEQGEYQVGRELGEKWNEMVMAVAHTPVELMARAIRDHWADCRVTLPELIHRGDQASLHFYIGALDGMRKQIFPSLLKVYEGWRGNGDWTPLAALANQGREHWSQLAQDLVRLLNQHGKAAVPYMKERVEAGYL